jgi:hypothetical protein
LSSKADAMLKLIPMLDITAFAKISYDISPCWDRCLISLRSFDLDAAFCFVGAKLIATAEISPMQKSVCYAASQPKRLLGVEGMAQYALKARNTSVGIQRA